MKKLSVVFLTLLSFAAVMADPRVWDPAGVPVRTGDFIDWDRLSIPNVDGDLLLVWRDSHTGTQDIYVRPVSTDLEWQWNGYQVLCPTAGAKNQITGIGVSDGWVIAWSEERNGSYDTYLQKFSLDGARLWPVTGVEILPEPGTTGTAEPRLVDDGAGGVLLAYSVGLEQSNQLAARRILNDGTTAWFTFLTADTLDWYRNECKAVPDGANGLAVFWQDSRTNERGIYGARVSQDGDLLWPLNGRRVVTDTYTAYDLRVVGNAGAGFYLCWRSSYDLCLQRVDADGDALWDSVGIRVYPNQHSQQNSQLALSRVAGASDGVIVTWAEARYSTFGEDREIFAQKLRPDSARVWPVGGVRLTTDTQYNPDDDPFVISDSAGGAVIGWVRYRDNVYASHLDSSGSFLWNPAGVDVTTGNAVQQPCALSADGSGNPILLWKDATLDSAGLRGQKLHLADGSRALGNAGQSLLAGVDGGAFGTPLTVPMSNGRAGIIWQDSRGNQRTRTCYQIISPNGQPERAAQGEPLTPGYLAYPYLVQEKANVCPDGGGGFFAMWEQEDDGSNDWSRDIIFAHVNSDGDLTTPPAGVTVQDGGWMYGEWDPHLAPDGAGGAFVFFDTGVWPGGVGVIRVNSGGTPVWGSTVLLDPSGGMYVMGILPADGNACTLLWYDYVSATDRHTKLTRMRSDGTIAWSANLSPNYIAQANIFMKSDAADGVYAVWQRADTTGMPNDIFAQYVDSAGTVMWFPFDGIAVAHTEENEFSPAMAVTPEGDLYVVWCSTPDSESYSLRAQKLNSLGDFLWGDAGLELVTSPGRRLRPSADTDASGGLFVIWSESHSQPTWTDIYGTHVDSSGVHSIDPYWTAEMGGAVSEQTGGEYYSSLARDGSGGWYVAWTNESDYSYYDTLFIFAQRVLDFPTRVGPPGSEVPTAYALTQNYPNPFNPSTVFDVSVPMTSRVTVKAYDILGREVDTLTDRVLAAGLHRLTWNCEDCASGTYLIVLSAPRTRIVREAILLR